MGLQSSDNVSVNAGEPSDESLMQAVRADGSPAAFAELVERYRRPLLNHFARLGVEADGEDLAQRTLVNVYRAREKYVVTAQFRTYLFAVARNVWLDELRWRRRKQAPLTSLADLAVEPEDAAAAAAGRRADAACDAERALACLGDSLRETVTLAFYDGFTYSEIGEILGIPEGTVKSRIFNAMAKMRDFLKRSGEDDF